MTIPGLFFGFILATLFGAAFHMLAGGDARRFALYLLAGWLGFTVGHIVGAAFGVALLMIGPLHTGSAGVGALVALIAAYILGVRLQTRS